MVLERIKNKQELTNSECIIGEYLLAHYEEISDLTAEEVAEKTFTSKATVIRFCKKMTNGKGFQEFKLALLVEMAKSNIVEQKKSSLIRGFSEYNSKQIAGEIYSMAINAMQLQVDEDKLAAVAAKMRTIDFIDLIGSGVDSCYAREMAYKLRRQKVFATALDDLYEYNLYEKDKNKMAFVFALQKPLTYAAELAKELKDRGYYVVSVVGGLEDELVEEYMGDVVCRIAQEQTLSESLRVVYQEMMLKYLLDILILEVEKAGE